MKTRSLLAKLGQNEANAVRPSTTNSIVDVIESFRDKPKRFILDLVCFIRIFPYAKINIKDICLSNSMKGSENIVNFVRQVPSTEMDVQIFQPRYAREQQTSLIPCASIVGRNNVSRISIHEKWKIVCEPELAN